MQGVEENFMQSLSAFLVLFGDKKKFLISFKSYLDPYFHPDIFNFSSYGSESRKRYILRLLLMCLERRFGICFVWGRMQKF